MKILQKWYVVCMLFGACISCDPGAHGGTESPKSGLSAVPSDQPDDPGPGGELCIEGECNGTTTDIVAGDASQTEVGCVLPGDQPSSSHSTCPAPEGQPLVTSYLPGDWPSSSLPPACVVSWQNDALSGNNVDLTPIDTGKVQSALATPACGRITTVTNCGSWDIRVGIVHNRLLNVGSEAWADAYYDANESSGCVWGSSLTIPYDNPDTITPVARGWEVDNDEENGYLSTSYFMEFWDCGSSSYCGTGSPSTETTTHCNGGGSFLDDHTITRSEGTDLSTHATQIWPVGGCNNLEIAAPCELYHTYGCARWYWFHLRTTQDNRWSFDRTADDYGCIKVLWCGSYGCPS